MISFQLINVPFVTQTRAASMAVVGVRKDILVLDMFAKKVSLIVFPFIINKILYFTTFWIAMICNRLI